MRRSRFDYHTYRGRGTASDWLKRIALVLAILVVLAVAFLFWVQPYVTYTDNGLKIDLPFLQENSEQHDAGNISVIEQDPGENQTDTSQEQQPQGQTAQAAIQVPLSALLDGTAVQLVEAQGGDGVVVDMKNDQGQLGWSSKQSLASAVQPEAQDPQINDKLKSWNDGDVYTIARMSCFRDESVGGQMTYTLQTVSGYRWKDHEEMHWSDPANQQVQDYLIGLMTELAEMGFDEIMLDHGGYPTQADGTQSNIRYGDQSAAQVADAFLARAVLALEPYGVKLSLAASEETEGSGNLVPPRTVVNMTQTIE